MSQALEYAVSSQQNGRDVPPSDHEPLIELYARLVESQRLDSHDSLKLSLSEWWREDEEDYGTEQLQAKWQGWPRTDFNVGKATELMAAGPGSQSLLVRLLGRFDAAEADKPVFNAHSIWKVTWHDVHEMRRVMSLK